jgi:hypothetical protein
MFSSVFYPKFYPLSLYIKFVRRLKN